MQKRRVLTIARYRRPTVHASDGTFGSGGARLGLSQKGGLPFRCLARHLIAAQGHRRAHPLRRGSYERATSSCFSTMEDRFGKRRADVHRRRDGRSCNGRDDCKENPFTLDG